MSSAYPAGSIGAMFPEFAEMVERLLSERRTNESQLATVSGRLHAVKQLHVEAPARGWCQGCCENWPCRTVFAISDDEDFS